MLDKIVEELEMQKIGIDLAIMKIKSENARESGEIFDSVDALVCNKHPNSKFKAVRKIPDSSIYAGRKEGTDKNWLNIYRCEGCSEDNKDLNKSKAYDCSVCGVVIGEIKETPYNNLGSLSGSSGIIYQCRICNTQLGRRCYKIS